MDNIELSILKDIDYDKVYKHLDFLVNDVGERQSGTNEIKKAAEYVYNELKSYGLDSRIDKFPMYNSYPIKAELKVLYPEDRIIAAEPVCHITSTIDDGIEGELIYAENGGYQDYKDKDIRGKIVLTDMTWSPGRPEKARIAYELGAKALIIMNWGPKEDNPVIQMGGVKSQWGNPTPDTINDMPLLPVISITRQAGEYLRDLCLNNNNVKVWLTAQATREWVEANQPMGILYSEQPTDEFVLIGGHIDAWGKAAMCNSSGNALLLEFARVLYPHKKYLKRNIVFSFWDGHEVAECGGSTWFVDNYWDKIDGKCIAYINVDNIAIKGTSVPGVESVSEVKKFTMNLIKKIWKVDGKWNWAYKGGGDSSFFGVGVPYISFATEYTDEKLKELNYAFYSPWLHSNEDTIDKIDKDLYKKHFEFFMTLLLRLCNQPVIPYSILDIADEVKEKLDKVIKLGNQEVSRELGVFKELFERFYNSAWEFSQIPLPITDSEMIRKYNKTLLKVAGKISPAIRSHAGRYGQDPCCYVIAEYPIPCLYHPIKKIMECKENNLVHEYNLWRTELQKGKNRVYDSLNESIEILNLFIKEYKK